MSFPPPWSPPSAAASPRFPTACSPRHQGGRHATQRRPDHAAEGIVDGQRQRRLAVAAVADMTGGRDVCTGVVALRHATRTRPSPTRGTPPGGRWQRPAAVGGGGREGGERGGRKSNQAGRAGGGNSVQQNRRTNRTEGLRTTGTPWPTASPRIGRTEPAQQPFQEMSMHHAGASRRGGHRNSSTWRGDGAAACRRR